ncbi:hypothetical protein [Pantoea ananatis]|uniref:hypothetical protein n=1 Tax=Pantoea ananas TaxID=553 RepID=UPI000D5FBA21|nr:hypothetical protein [Pantoea ananatis]PVY86591.1 hypothetical protein C7427_10243 [Pantoea ananatis]
MYSTTALVFWALITLISGFLAGLLTGIFGGKNQSPKAKEIITSIKVDWQDIEEHVEKRVSEITHEWFTDQKEPATEKAQSEPPKNAITDALLKINRELPTREEVTMPDDVIEDSTLRTAAAAPVTVSTDNTDAVLAKVKELLKVTGHDVEAVFDDVASLAKKLA